MNELVVNNNKNKDLNEHKLKQIGNIAKSTSNKVYGSEVDYKEYKSMLINFTKEQHAILLKYANQCKIEGKKEHSSINQIVRELTNAFIEENKLN